MKIGIIVRYLLSEGGVERQVVQFAQELKESGHEAFIYTLAYDKEHCFPVDTNGLSIVSLSSTKGGLSKVGVRVPFLGTILNLYHEIKMAKKLALLMDPSLEAINAQDHPSAWVSYYFKKLIKNVPAILSLNDLHLARWSLFREQEGVEETPLLKYVLQWIRDTLENFFFISAQERIAVLNTFTQKMVKKYLGRDALIIRVGLDADHFPYMERSSISRKKIKILCHAIFYVHRRFEDVILAASLLRKEGYDAELVISGDYLHKDTARMYYQKLSVLVKELGLDGFVKFPGRISEHDLLSELKESDVFVFSSHMQTWGMIVFEAMATGLPVVVSKTAGASEVLKDYENAMLVAPLSGQEIYKAIKALADDSGLYQKLSKQGADFARNNVSWKKYTEEMISVFQEIVPKR